VDKDYDDNGDILLVSLRLQKFTWREVICPSLPFPPMQLFKENLKNKNI